MALAAHLMDLATLCAVFLAFHLPVGPGVLAATYGMAILFWRMSPVPEGIGVVGGMTFWLPLAFGFFTLRRLPVFQAPRTERSD